MALWEQRKLQKQQQRALRGCPQVRLHKQQSLHLATPPALTIGVVKVRGVVELRRGSWWEQ
jgi:hypothetical protein